MFKIALLFLTISTIHHEGHWQDFLKNNEDRYSLYIHSKESLAETDSIFKRYEIKNKVETTWANTMRAQIELLREALEDPDNEKFIFISESTIPLQDFDTVYDFVMATNKSIFPFHINAHQDKSNHEYYNPDRILHPIPSKLQYKNPQWVILNRKHAKLMVEDELYIDIVTRYMCDNEHYPSTFLAIRGLLDEVVNQQTTYVEWNIPSPLGRPHPYTFTDFIAPDQLKLVEKALRAELYRPPYMFGRKFSRECDLSPLDSYLSYRIKWDWGSKSESV